jgi:hypothetical protein
MKALVCILTAFVVSACAQKKTEAGTPIADSFIENQATFVVDNCGGNYTNACRKLFWNAFVEALAAAYSTGNSKEANDDIFCDIHPSDCIDLRETEVLFQGPY